MTGRLTPQIIPGRVTRPDPRLNKIVPTSFVIEKLASGFGFTEGPIWVEEGYLLFSDIPNNVIIKWSPDGQLCEFRKPSGYHGRDATPGAHLGPNGLALDRQGRLLICEHGNRRLTRLEKDGTLTVLAADYQGKRLNSPNDVVWKLDGSVYFTDPPYGLPERDADPAKELPFSGIYRLVEGELVLLNKDLNRPNGLAFSPDERYLYVSNSDPARKVWVRFDVERDGTLAHSKLFYDATQVAAPGLPDGLKLDQMGNLYCTGPGGIWVFAPTGEHLGTLEFPEVPANCNWGDGDAKTLYVTARTSLYRVRLRIAGLRPTERVGRQRVASRVSQ